MSTKKQQEEQSRTWIRKETYRLLKEESETRGIKVIDIFDYLVLTMKRYDLLSEGWEAKLTGERMKEYKEKIETQFTATMTKEGIQHRNRVQRDVIKAYLDVLDPAERKTFIESKLGNLSDPDFIDQLLNTQFLRLDGKKYPVKYDSEGKPIFKGLGREVVPCELGYHTVNGFCECDHWGECDLRMKERQDFRWKTSPEAQQARRMEAIERDRRKRRR